MFILNKLPHLRRLVRLTMLITLSSLLFPAALLAAPPDPPQPEPCGGCHVPETETWQASPHAGAGQPAAACQDCHGSYVPGHPEQGLMPLRVDSSPCEQCHQSTVAQWASTTHAQAGVQCISCHLSHSQKFRLTDEALCGACHRERQEDFNHTVHGEADVACTDCHVSTSQADQPLLASLEIGPVEATAPSHQFNEVAPEDCLQCHTGDVHTGLPPTGGMRVANARTLALAETVPALTDKLETTEQEKHTFQIMTPVAFGLGLGVGGMLGIIATLVIWRQRRINL